MSASAYLRIAAALAAMFVLGCGGGDNDGSTPPEQTASPSAGEEQGANAEPEDAEMTKIWLTTGEQLKPVERELDGGGDEVEAAAEELVDGPTEKEEGGDLDAATEIPAGVEVEKVEVAGDGTATVEVSKDFLAGIPADPDARDTAQDEALDARLSQVTYTLTQFDDVEATKVVAGGISAGPAARALGLREARGRPTADHEGEGLL